MKNIAFIAAHSDDNELSAGGLIYKLYQAQKNVYIIHTSTSDYKNFQGETHRTREEVEFETQESMKVLGVPEENIFCLGYPTKFVPYNSEIIEKIDRICTEYNIDTVFTHPADDSHHDHANTGKAVLSAGRRLPNIFNFEPVFPANSRQIFNPNWYVDISGDAYNQKVRALERHTSQAMKYGKKWFDSIDALSRLRGCEIDVYRAECFTVLKRKAEL
jgi:LmbE family N-acetylglucosaminyl deacetylase